jgi:hypothetical protein
MAELSDAIEALLSGRGQAGNVVTLRAKGAG